MIYYRAHIAQQRRRRIQAADNMERSARAGLGKHLDNYRHTLGNLTLTGYNSEYSNRPFAEKRDMVGGFKESPLRLNVGMGQAEAWDEPAIKARAGKLAERAAGVWASPKLPPDIIDAYQTKAPSAGYRIEDHPHLLSAAMRELFESFRKEVLALDPSVTEEFLKLLCRLQGRDELCRCHTSGQTATALAKYEIHRLQ